MSCAACVSRVERAVCGVEGVTDCSVSLLTSSMSVEGTAKSSDIIEAVERAGYGASLKGAKSVAQLDNELEDRETPKIKKRLFASLGFLILLMYVSMGHVMWSFPMLPFFENNQIAIGLLQMILSGILLVINQKFFINGFKGLIKGAPNMDTLVALGSGVSYIYSVVCLFLMTKGEHLLHGLYFESAGMILVLITVGKLLEAHSKGKTTSALKELMSLQPKTAIVLVDGKEQVISASQIKKGDIFVVKAGVGVVTDGTVIEGQGAVDESMLTGEGLPSDKEVNHKVYAGTTVRSGYLVCRADKESGESVLDDIIKTVTDSASSKAPIARVADKVSGVFVPAVITIAIVTFIIWMLIGQDVGYSLARGISVLVISCPCALGLATPVAIMVGNGVGARRGILFKTAAALESTGRATTVVLDKTGTITKGEPSVVDVIPFGVSENELLSLAYSVESKSEHPLATAIVKKAEEKGASLYRVDSFSVLLGSGVEGVIDGHKITGGSFKHISHIVKDISRDEFDALSSDGKTPLYFARDNKLIGIIAVRDEIKEDSPSAIEELKEMNIKTVMLTGDNENSARAIGSLVGVDKIISQVMPTDKERVISELIETENVIMVGDGINDAPALTKANIGIAIGGGTQIAIDSADIVLINNSLSGVANAIKLSRKTLKNIHENLFWAFIYNVIGIPLAAGAFVALLGWELSPMFGALAMSLSSFCVVTNALRLNFIKLDKEKKEMFGKKKESGIVLSVTGMMCPHCEARVKKAVMEIEGVTNAEPSHKKNTVIVYGDCDIEKVKAVIAEQGYQVK